MNLNISPIKELLILLGGPIFQFTALIILNYLFPTKQEIINYYHYSILLFNLLPVYPLDGGRIINLLMQIFITYKKGFKLSIIFKILDLIQRQLTRNRAKQLF